MSGDLIISDRWLEGYPITIEMRDVNDLHRLIGVLDFTVHFICEWLLMVEEWLMLKKHWLAEASILIEPTRGGHHGPRKQPEVQQTESQTDQ